MNKNCSRHWVQIFIISLISFTYFLTTPAQAALTIGTNTGNFVSNTGGGTLFTSICSGASVLSGIGGQNYGFDGPTLTKSTGNCATLSSDGQTISSTLNAALGPYGDTAGTALPDVNCSTSGGNQVIVGGRIYKTTNGYTAGVMLLCGTLPLGSSRTNGGTLGTTTSTYQDIACNVGSVANGLYVYKGGILDKWGISCVPILTIPQSISISSLGASSATYPYTQTLNISTSGSNGTGAISFSVTNGTASGCSLSSSLNNATLTASSSGTCLLTATIAADTNYVSASSSSAIFTFNRAGQAALTITSTTGVFGTTLTLTTNGGSGTGSISYTYAAGTTTCSLSTNLLTANGSGTCLITATKSSDTNYSSISSSQTTVTFSQANSTLTLTYPAGNFVFRQLKILTAVSNAAGKISFKSNNVFIPGCRNVSVGVENSFTATCNFRPTSHGAIKVSATFTPTNPGFIPSSAISPVVIGNPRTNTK